MCGGKGLNFAMNPIGYVMSKKQSDMEKKELKKQQASEEADQRARTNAVTQITGNFGQFNPNFYANLEKNASEYYQGQLGDQYGDAKQQLVRNLASNGLTDTSAAARLFGTLAKKNLAAQQAVKNQAISERQSAQAKIEGSRGELIDRVNQGGNIGEAVTSAGQSAAALTQPAPYSLFGDVFGGFLTGLASTLRDNPAFLQRGGSSVAFPTSGGRENVVGNY